jgi:hypothetical protein
MRLMDIKISTVIMPALFGFFFFSSAVLNTNAQVNYAELRCRGGADLFRLDNLGTIEGTADILLGISFSPSTKPAGADSLGLEPGSCGWLDRMLTDLEPQQIQFRITPAEASALAAYLQDSNNYWSFIIADTARGYYQTSSHQAWKPQAITTPAKPLQEK